MAGEQEQPQRVRSDGEPMQLDRLVHDTSAEPVGVSAASDEEVVSVKQHANGGDLAVDNEEPEQDASSKKCAFCPTKKVSAVVEQKAVEPLRAKKPVLKREFKESNFVYYEETVAIFCVKDFFASKKMSQGILNDQVRSLRVNGSYAGKQLTKKRRVKDPEIKAKIKSVLSNGAPYSPRQA